jgi:hypothetical protein
MEQVPIQEEAMGMCYEHWQRRRREEDEESREIWQDFQRTTPISDPRPDEVTEVDLAEPQPAETAPER